MLTIRQEQMDAFAQEAVRSFECRLQAHLTRVFPASCQELGETNVRQVMRDGMKRAEGYGIVSELDVVRYVDLMFILGADFDRDGQMPWASAILNDRQADPTARMDELTRRSEAYLERQAAGERPR